jgi:hypothetical protein
VDLEYGSKKDIMGETGYFNFRNLLALSRYLANNMETLTEESIILTIQGVGSMAYAIATGAIKKSFPEGQKVWEKLFINTRGAASEQFVKKTLEEMNFDTPKPKNNINNKKGGSGRRYGGRNNSFSNNNTNNNNNRQRDPSFCSRCGKQWTNGHRCETRNSNSSSNNTNNNQNHN